ncbi:uncharacterized protein LOC131427109 [Malaya genurostris]|uniref:uncharacterized protein LOC131427109 n=1 Tax=Malaya genurostris TaxID=325434 RepID=UPI0026F3B52E|nr:uncharacterized protein LOC131427109 [Malaya genurostris]
MIDTYLSKSQYIKIQSRNRKRNSNIYPSYHRILIAKKSCYPMDSSITVTDTEVDINLQALLDHTSKRIVEANAEKLETFSDEELMNIILTVKWGMDGSTGNSEYNQVFENDNGLLTDASVFITSMVPIEARSIKKVFFQNPRPSSTRLCRPIRILFEAETSELIIRERQYIEDQILSLKPTIVTKHQRTVQIKYCMLFTMVDGKVCSAVTETSSSQSSSRCYICQAKPTDMNNIQKVCQRSVNVSSYQFGLSTLHAWIRFLEYFLHVAYRLDLKKWQVRGEDKIKIIERKKNLQKRFKIEMGMNIDKPRAGGSGTSNDGSILQVLASGCQIDTAKFNNYCIETAQLLVHLYPWYYLPCSVHKILKFFHTDIGNIIHASSPDHLRIVI